MTCFKCFNVPGPLKGAYPTNREKDNHRIIDSKVPAGRGDVLANRRIKTSMLGLLFISLFPPRETRENEFDDKCFGRGEQLIACCFGFLECLYGSVCLFVCLFV